MRAIRKVFARLLLIIALVLAPFSTAFAHASLVKAEPPLGAVLIKSPDKITFSFSEEIEPKFSAFVLYDAQGNKLKELSFALEDGLQVAMRVEPLPTGTYTLAWNVLSAIDGHITKGIYPFAVGVSTAQMPKAQTGTASSPSVFRGAVRWLGFLSIMALVGGLFFRLLIPRVTQIPALIRHFKIVLWASWLIFVATGLSDLILQTLTISEASFAQLLKEGFLAQLLFQTRYGWVWLVRYALVFIMALLLALQPSSRWLLATLGSLVLLSISLSSHSAALESFAYLAVFADWMHLLAASLWIGGLLQLALFFPALRRLENEERARLMAELVPRFYQWAFISAAVLLLTGFHLTYRHIPNLEAALWATSYGRAFLVKHLLLLALVALAAVNLLWVWPRFAKAPIRLLRLETLFAVVIVFFAGMLTLVPPAKQALQIAQEPQSHKPSLFTKQADGLTVALMIKGRASPTPTVGENEFDVFLATADGQPIHDALRVMLQFAFLGEDIGAISAILETQHDGHYKTRGSFLSIIGRWQIEVIIRLKDRVEDVRAIFQIEAKAKTSDGNGEHAHPEERPSKGLQLWPIMVLTLGGLLVLLALLLRRYAKSALWLAVLPAALGLLSIGFGAALFLTPISTPKGPLIEAPPIAGQLLYHQHCAMCHGNTGQGDGPLAATLPVKPADLTMHLLHHSDAQLAEVIRSGRGQAMPAFESTLNEEQIRQLIRYLRALPQQRDEQAVKDIVLALAAALEAKDFEELNALFHPNAIIIEQGNQSFGWSVYRDAHLKPELESFRELRYRHDQILVRFSGAAAWVTFAYHLEAKVSEQTIKADGRGSMILEKHDNQWLIMHLHFSRHS